jgi:cytochrome c oxidase assembly protein subunit 15
MLKRHLKTIFSSLLLFQALLVVTGGAVRITGSGLGCPTWPTCTGNSYKPVAHQAQGQLHAWIEFGNRLIAWLIFIAAVLALVGVIKYLKERPDYLKLRTLAIYQLLGFVAQVVLGGITVLTKLNPASVGAHFLLSLPLISGAFSLRARYVYTDSFPLTRIPHLMRTLFLSMTILLLVIGTVVTGSGPLAGDLQAKRYHLDGSAVAHIHSYIAIATLISILGFFISLKLYEGEGLFKQLLKPITFLIVILLIQGLIGYRQLALGLPELLVGIHLLGAALTWIATWNIVFKTKNR